MTRQTRIPRALARARRAHEPSDPLLAMLKAYGITEYVPTTSEVTWTREGITLDVFARGEDGQYLLHDDETGIVTIRRFYPHPKKPTL